MVAESRDDEEAPSTMRSMLLAGKVWTYWIAVPLALGAVLAVVATIGGYLKKVQSLKYPKR
jgi:hypothetical protein